MSLLNREIRVILSNFDIGAGRKGAAAGTKALLNELDHLGIRFGDQIILNQNGEETETGDFPYCRHIQSVMQAAALLNDEMEDAVKNRKFPLIFSGDHSNAIGGISGLKNANPEKRIGVIWVDAHADLHSPFTTPSGNIHGMPVAALTGIDNRKRRRNPVSETEEEAWKNLKGLGKNGLNPKIAAEDVVYIGLRDAEQEEWGLIDELGILYFGPDELKEHGIFNALNRGLEHLSPCDLLYVSFDADSLDPSVADGTGTTAPDGLKRTEAAAIFETLMKHPKLGAWEITEINPRLDTMETPMARVMAGLLADGLKHEF